MAQVASDILLSLLRELLEGGSGRWDGERWNEDRVFLFSSSQGAWGPGPEDWVSASRAPVVEENLRHDSKHCPVLLGKKKKKNLKGKKTIVVDRMFPITGEPENRKWVGGGVWRGCANIWRGWGRVGGEKRRRRIKYKKWGFCEKKRRMGKWSRTRKMTKCWVLIYCRSLWSFPYIEMRPSGQSVNFFWAAAAAAHGLPTWLPLSQPLYHPAPETDRRRGKKESVRQRRHVCTVVGDLRRSHLGGFWGKEECGLGRGEVGFKLHSSVTSSYLSVWHLSISLFTLSFPLSLFFSSLSLPS